jgi:hypothetical protein
VALVLAVCIRMERDVAPASALTKSYTATIAMLFFAVFRFLSSSWSSVNHGVSSSRPMAAVCLDPIRLARFGETSTRSRLVVNGSDLGE